MAEVMNPARAQQLIDELGNHNLILADQAEQLDTDKKNLGRELEKTRQKLAAAEERHQEEVDAIERQFDEIFEGLFERIKALEARVRGLEEELR